jgi:hypothetical protein
MAECNQRQLHSHSNSPEKGIPIKKYLFGKIETFSGTVFNGLN